MSQAIANPDRQTGRYYTPRFLVDAMLRLALAPLVESSWETLRILDPACGDGAFLLAIQEWLKSNALEKATSVQLSGVDIDQSALSSLRSQSEDGCIVHWGDALTGRGFHDDQNASDKRTHHKAGIPDLDWPAAFPDANRAGGFDLVIGNPPYRRELASKTMRDRLKQSPWAKKWQQPRLDLWGYFLHRGLDLLKPGGRLAFVLPSYWTASTGAERLIERLNTETTLRDVVLLGSTPVFPGVVGRHLILSLEKSRRDLPCRVWDVSQPGEDVAENLKAIGDPPRDSASPSYHLEPTELYQHGGLCLSKPDPVIQSLGQAAGGRTLSDRFEVRQGIVENPRRITRKIAEHSAGEFQAGQGVFVLDHEEITALDLSPQERDLLRPYYRASGIERYAIEENPSEFLLYLTRESAADLDEFPRIRKHLLRFRSLLENRREVQRGRIPWWHLHWPRDERIFLAPRILMPQMARSPRFVFCPEPAFVGFAVNVILAQAEGDAVERSRSLLALTGVLNSKLAARWFRKFAKHRGVSLDISGGVLKRFPLPPEDPEKEQVIAGLVKNRQERSGTSNRALEREAEIESLVEDWYRLPVR